ncbi:uncharacterized protein LOC115543102 [Gadus morhua]|uniref:uncharacterized protein LOC115543102 n=1 Tax=Gadus morhua TaxID=8049 RepID=UPI0011B56188|nr:uncharacterized protein LOC115543102 [Gadus morhua]
MPGSSATKAPTTGSEVAAETGNAAAPGLSIRRGEAGGDAPSSSRSESSDSELTRREGIVERDSKVVGPFSNGGRSVGSAALSVVHQQRHTMPTQAERRERQDGMFMPKAALAHLMAVICTVDGGAVWFETMTRGLQKVRRLSSISSVLQPTFLLTTEWLWYWEEEDGNWNQYDSPNNSSTELEQRFQNDPQEVVEFTAGSQAYTLSLKDMIQTNKTYGTKRLVRRRPRFLSSADVQIIRKVLLQDSSEEYKEVETLFRQTMTDFDIVKIERIQNKSLWDQFQLQTEQMKMRNGGRYVAERKLFHGTDSKFINAICCSNFDWRICGIHGTAYGKGSYFARDASYSHKYIGNASTVRSMFVSRVLVGHHTWGDASYVRPPSKDGGDTLIKGALSRRTFYDSCVDDIHSPSIFVVFDRPQIYPEFLLTYKEKAAVVDDSLPGLLAAADVQIIRASPLLHRALWTADHKIDTERVLSIMLQVKLLIFFYFSRNGPPNFQAFPRHWDKTQVPDVGYKKVLLQDSSEEYKEVETLFRQTMTDFDIVKIERIQNKSLWDQFQLQTELIKMRNGGRYVAERKLFHGTDSKFINAICCSNFDWRICGTNGTAYGKGSYFARDASYSHKYIGNASTVRSMFVSRVLVGHHTWGDASYVRPPSKDGGDTLIKGALSRRTFYDSCVDDIHSPSIFVVFDRPQIYPEFLLTYKEKAAVVDDSLPGLLAAAALVVKPTPVVKPPPGVKPMPVSRAKPPQFPGAFSYLNGVPPPPQPYRHHTKALPNPLPATRVPRAMPLRGSAYEYASTYPKAVPLSEPYYPPPPSGYADPPPKDDDDTLFYDSWDEDS